MLDNFNFVGEKGIKGKKFLVYGLFCYVEISIKICIIGIEFISKSE